jgi:hypothetical protein
MNYKESSLSCRESYEHLRDTVIVKVSDFYLGVTRY